MGTVNSFLCGKSGHYGKDCKAHLNVCFRCNKPGHRMAECPEATGDSGRPAWQPPLRITEGEKGKKPEVPKPRGRAFQMTVEEAKKEPDVIAGPFIVNSLPALVLFDSGASKSFVSTTFLMSL